MAIELLPQYRGVEVVPRARDYLIDGERYRRVSTITNVIDDGKSRGLMGWAKKETLKKVQEILRNPEVEGGLAQIFADGGSPAEYGAWVDRVMAAGKKAADAKRDAAADRGTCIHEEIRQALSPPYVERVISDECGHALNFIEDNGITVDAVEMTLWDPETKVAGTCDGIGRNREGERIIWDWKTGKGSYPQMVLQLGAYAQMLEWMTGDIVCEAYILKLSPNGCQPHPLNRSELLDGMAAFTSTYTNKMRFDVVRAWGRKKGWWR